MLCNKTDGVLVALQVALRVAFGARTFTQHVVGKRERIAGFFSCSLGFMQGLCHGLAQHKLPPQQLDRAQRRSHHRLGAECAHESWFMRRVCGSFG